MIYSKTTDSQWRVDFTRKARKQVDRLDSSAFAAARLLVEDLRKNGPAPGKKWPNYGRLRGSLKKDRRHCHLIKGQPTYVCCWEIINKKIRIIEVYYVGTHEKAPY